MNLVNFSKKQNSNFQNRTDKLELTNAIFKKHYLPQEYQEAPVL